VRWGSKKIPEKEAIGSEEKRTGIKSPRELRSGPFKVPERGDTKKKAELTRKGPEGRRDAGWGGSNLQPFRRKGACEGEGGIGLEAQEGAIEGNTVGVVNTQKQEKVPLQGGFRPIRREKEKNSIRGKFGGDQQGSAEKKGLLPKKGGVWRRG